MAFMHAIALPLAHFALTFPVALCYKTVMRLPKFVFFLLAFFVAFAAFPGGMAVAAVMQGSAAMSCHELPAVDPDSSMTHRHHDAGLNGQHAQQEDGPASQKLPPQSQSDCCVGFVGILSLTFSSPLLPSARETFLFRPSLRLASGASGIYRPPRQYT
jgi:hypothetical protein